jgi:hypothetical protein
MASEGEPYPHTLSVVFRPGIDVFDRGDIEEALEGALDTDEAGEVLGGGGDVSGTESDIGLQVADLVTGLALVRRVLIACEVPTSTVVVQHEPRRVEHPVYV